eukprot:10170290-Alexandrium_andersonii.AAC.1
MSASLVGSEMCIRDRFLPRPAPSRIGATPVCQAHRHAHAYCHTNTPRTVSYTHLTLPTICSV